MKHAIGKPNYPEHPWFDKPVGLKNPQVSQRLAMIHDELLLRIQTTPTLVIDPNARSRTRSLHPLLGFSEQAYKDFDIYERYQFGGWFVLWRNGEDGLVNVRVEWDEGAQGYYPQLQSGLYLRVPNGRLVEAGVNLPAAVAVGHHLQLDGLPDFVLIHWCEERSGLHGPRTTGVERADEGDLATLFRCARERGGDWSLQLSWSEHEDPRGMFHKSIATIDPSYVWMIRTMVKYRPLLAERAFVLDLPAT